MAILTPQQRIKKCHIWAMNDPRFAFFSGVMMMGRSEITTKVQTAGTDGVNKFYNPDFIAPLNDKQLRFLVLHENYHVGARHMALYTELAKIDRNICNMALDHWINNALLDADPNSNDIQFINGGCLDRKYKDWTVKKIFTDLRQQQQQQQKSKGQGQGQGTGTPEDSNGEGDGGLDEHDWEAGEAMTPAEQKELAEAIDQALRQGAILAGKLGGNMTRALGELLAPKVDWKTVLAEFLKEVMAGKDSNSWSKLNRRFVGEGIYLPASISESIGRLCVAIDTSGSIDEAMITKFASELVSICKEVQPDGVSIYWWDTQVAGVQEFTREEFTGIDTKLIPQGGGGTDVGCVFDYIDKNKDEFVAIVVLTDGYTPYPAPYKTPTLFAMTEKSNVAPWGQTVYIDD